jgi:hypothetical protein
MNNIKWMRPTWLGATAVVGLLFLVGVTLTGCADPMAIAAVEPTPTVYAPPPTDIPPPPPGPTPAALGFPLPAPTKSENESVDDQTCVDCHTSEDQLKQTAMIIEQGESLSEGEG